MINSINDLRIENQRIQKLHGATKDWIRNTWKQYPPEWFITLLWNDLPTDPVVASSHTRHFRNVLLCDLLKCRNCSSVPDFPDRLGITAFQERTETQGKITFHTHLHLSNTNGHWSSEEELHCYLRYVIGKKVQKLLKTDTPGNKGVVVLPWVEEQHMTYNFKEMNRKHQVQLTRYIQDGDLLLDVERSDLLSKEANHNHGYKRSSGKSNSTL